MDVEEPSAERAADLRLPRAGEVVAERYRIDELLGEGGMGAVFRAFDLRAEQLVAIKIMRPEEVDSSDSVRRFTREARAARAIASEHVAKVLEVGKLGAGLPYIVLELLVGEPFDRLISERAPLPIAEAVGYVLQACEGIAQAHALGIIHRDLKPANLYLYRTAGGDDVVKVLDFGIAKTTLKLDPNTDGISLTETSSTLGSPQYMSPEQLRSSKHVDVGTDIWALGLILFKLLTGHAAFHAETVGQHFAMILSEAPTRLRALRSEAPAALEAVILCCLEKQPADRFQDVSQLGDALVAFGPEGCCERAARIRQILERSGAAAASRPSGRSHAELQEPSPASGVTRRVHEEVGGATARAWNTAATGPMARKRSTSWLLGGALGALVLGSAGGYAWLGAGRHPAGAPPSDATAGQAPATLGESDSTRAASRSPAGPEGSAAATEDSSVAPQPSGAAAANTKAQGAKPSASGSGTVRPTGSGQASAAVPTAKPSAVPVPTATVKPKGPMEDTL